MAIDIPAKGRADDQLIALASQTLSLENRLSLSESDIDAASSVDSLTTRVSTEESTRASQATSLTTRVSTAECTEASTTGSLTTRVSAEESSRASGDLSLTTRVSVEESTRALADTSLTTRVSTEESTRASADTSLTTADTSLTNRVSTEESVRASAVTSATTSINTRVSTEESTRASADLSLTTRVSTEESTRASADTSLTTRVSTEESTRSTADASLTTRVSTEESTRTSADTSLTTRVSTLSARGEPIELYRWREVDANGDVANAAGNGGILAADTTPILRGNAAETQEISWATGNTDPICATVMLKPDFSGAGNATLDLWVSSGAVGPDAASFTVETGWDGGALVSDTATDGTPGASIHKITATIAAADIPDGARFLTVILTPAAHANDTIQFFGAFLNPSSTA